MTKGLLYLSLWGSPYQVEGMSDLLFIIIIYYQNSCTEYKQCRPDQTPQSALSDLGLHYLPMSLLYWAPDIYARSGGGGGGGGVT